MDQKTIQKTKICSEMETDKSHKWFAYTQKKFISHIDTFYYSVKTVGDWSTLLGASALTSFLSTAKDQAQKEQEPQPFHEDTFPDLVVKAHGFGMYQYCIAKEDNFDIFVADRVPNRDTNAIIVQLRSESIWLHGLKKAIKNSLKSLVKILDRYGIVIANMTENRIDFAYHTNYIQDMLSFFKEETLAKMHISGYVRWLKEGTLQRDFVQCDYITLGRRKSNSSFIRIYNKSKEVIEMGYKQFFVPIWQQNGLISSFDRYVFDCVFESGKNSWGYKEVARCRFYLDYGADEEIKCEIRKLMAFEDSSIDSYRQIADSCVPDLTDIVNIEVQTKRKFYYEMVFPEIKYPKSLPVAAYRLYKINKMLQSIRDFITHDTIRFVNFKGEYANMRRERRPTADWWNRLSACGELGGISYPLCRDYQKRFDTQRSKSRSLTSLATFASLIEDWRQDDHTIYEDFENVICNLNDNDLDKYTRMRARKRKEIQARFGDGITAAEVQAIKKERYNNEHNDEQSEIPDLYDLCKP